MAFMGEMHYLTIGGKTYKLPSSGGSGTVTSVGVANAANGGLSVSGSPITSSGTITIGLASGYGDTKNPYASKTKNYVLAAPATANGVPTFRALVAADIPISDWAKASTKPSYNFSEIGSKPTTLSGYGITDAYTKTQVDGLVSGVLHYKGTKATVSALPTSGNTTGDVWHVTADGSEWAWDGSAWQELGTAIDLSGYAQLSGASFTGPVTFGDSVTADELETGDLVVTGAASFTNNIAANTINGVAVGSSPKFTDTVTTVTTTGSGNAITAISATNGAITATKGTTFLTSHQDISGKADKSATVSNVAYDSTNAKITKTINGTTSDVVTVATLKTALGSMPASDVSSWAKASTKPTYTASEVGAAASSHTHGNITNGGDITATAPTIASGDQIIINDNSASKITNGPTFDGSTTTKALTQKGTWETFATSDTNTTYTLSNALSSHKFTETLTAGGSGSGTSTATMEFVAGTGITLTDDTTNKKITIASSVTNTDKKLELEEVANATVYYPVVGSGTTANVRQYDATGFKYVPQNGSASSDGSATLTLGNSTASGTVGNKQGKLVLYGTTAYTHTIVGAPTSNKTITLPDETGTVALTSDVTDKKVKQTNNTTSNANLRILFSPSAIDTDQTSGVNKSSDFTYNPSTKALSTGGPINGYALAAASAKDVDTSIGAASASTNLPTSAAVAAFVEGKGYITETTVTSSGSGNVVTGMTASNGVITYTMGTVSTTAAQIIRW